MNTPTPRTDEAAYSMGRSGEHRDIERWCDLLNESRKLEKELTAAREELKAVTEQRDKLAELSGFGEFDKQTELTER